jgi:hypothetical protein
MATDLALQTANLRVVPTQSDVLLKINNEQAEQDGKEHAILRYGRTRNVECTCQTERWRNAWTDFSTGKMPQTMFQAVRALC